MASRTRSTATMRADLSKATAPVWDQIETGELAFDFSGRPKALPSSARSRAGRGGKRSVKDAILRWLEEQL